MCRIRLLSNPKRRTLARVCESTWERSIVVSITAFISQWMRAGVPTQPQTSQQATCYILRMLPEVQPDGRWQIKILGTMFSIFWCFLQSSACHPQRGHTDSPTVLEENFKSNSTLLFPFKLTVKFPLTSVGVQFTLNTSNGNWNMQNTDIIKQHFWAFFFNLAFS